MKKLILFLLILLPINSSAFSPDSTHAGLSQEIVDYYNMYFGNKISEEEKELIIQGSIDEDEPVSRVLNHFYDPIRNIGLDNANSSKDWATGRTDGNNFSWDIGIDAYARGEKEEAFKILGHILHLIEDVGVPDHTRNDQHLSNVDESPFENWAKENKNKKALASMGEQYFLSKIHPIYKKNLDEYFDYLANYSNKNFFSKDTIENPVYQYTEPDIIEIDEDYGYGIDSLTGKKIKLYVNFLSIDGKIYKVLQDEYGKSVFEEYFDRLALQIIPTGAGVIDLFFKEGEVAKKKYEEENQKEVEVEEGDLVSYITQYIWSFLPSTESWGIVTLVKEVTATVTEFFEPSVISNVTEITAFTTNMYVEFVADETKKGVENTVNFVQQNPQSFLVGPIFAFEPPEDSNQQEEIPPKPSAPAEEVPQIITPILPETPQFVIIPGFGGGNAPPLAQNIVPEEEEILPVETPEDPDLTPPDVNLNIPICEHSLVAGQCVLAGSIINISWVSEAEDVTHYSIVIDEIESATSTATEAELSLVEGEHNIFVKATDSSGNTGTSPTIAVEYIWKPIFISEIAWAGTATSSANEWLEIYNRSPYTIDLTNVSIKAEGGAPEMNLSGNIVSGMYYLIERGSDDSVPGITADKIVVFNDDGRVRLSDEGEKLKLIHLSGGQEIIIDQTPSVSVCSGWCEGSSINKSTMYRKSINEDDEDPDNWETDGNISQTVLINGGGEEVLGSPREPKQEDGAQT